MGRTHNRNADLCAKNSTDMGIGLVVLRCYARRKAAKEGFRFSAKQAVRGNHKRGEMPALISTWLKIFLLLFLFVGFENF